MSFAELLLLAVGLAMDAFAVSVCKGLALKKASALHCAAAGAWFGGFQALMPLLGYLLGSGFAQLIEKIDHWLAFILLSLIGIGMIREAVGGGEESMNASMDVKTMFLLAVATSIDALAVGVTLAFLHVNVLWAVGVIGCVTFVLSFAGVAAGSRFGEKIGSRAEIAGGLILIGIGLRILIQHLSGKG